MSNSPQNASDRAVAALIIRDELVRQIQMHRRVGGADNNEVATPNSPPQSEENGERTCWICFATDEDNKLAEWLQPCRCRGTTKWVHKSCLNRWVDEKQKGNAFKTVVCQQCQTEYIIVFPKLSKFANVLETFDHLCRRLSPYFAAGVIVGSMYWTAVTYGAVTVLQVVGHKEGLALMENGDPLLLLIGLPAIPVGLVLGRMIQWEDAVLRLIRNRQNMSRKLPIISFIMPYPQDEAADQPQQPPQQDIPTPAMSDPSLATRAFCGALLLPTISTIVGKIFFDSIESPLHRTLLGGLTFIVVKGVLKIYLKQQQYNRKKERQIVDYTDYNVKLFVTKEGGSAGSTSAPSASQPQIPENLIV